MRLAWLPCLSMATVLVLLPTGLGAESLEDYVKGAFATEEQQIHSRTEFRVRRGDKSTEYLIERVLPDRLHMLIRGGSADQEAYVVGTRMFVLRAGVWQEAPAPTRARLPASMSTFIAKHLSGIREEAANDNNGSTRVFVIDQFNWRTGAGDNVGSLTIQIDVPTQLPSKMIFDGTCQDIPCAFDQVITFDPNIVIDPPIP